MKPRADKKWPYVNHGDLGRQGRQRRFTHGELFNPDVISRRHALSFLWSAAALGLAAAATVLTVSNSEAQTSGMERRGDRRTGRGERRDKRRTGRTDRREERRN